MDHYVSGVTVRSQRFAGIKTLEACLAGNRRVLAGEPDAVAVTRLQDALADLGYLPLIEVDGVFGSRTGRAVTEYKTDEGLSPNDPVVGKGTMAALDTYYAVEPADGDLPDASIDGLLALAESACNAATTWVDTAAAGVAKWADPPAPDAVLEPARELFERALRRNFHLDRTAADAHWFTHFLIPMFEVLPEILGRLRVEPMHRTRYLETAPVYIAASLVPGLRITVTPPFRNVLSPVERAGILLHFATMASHPAHARVLGRPGTPRYDGLSTYDCMKNTLSWVGFSFECRGGTAGFPPGPIWYPSS
jgi:hypothetical protein